MGPWEDDVRDHSKVRYVKRGKQFQKSHTMGILSLSQIAAKVGGRTQESLEPKPIFPVPPSCCRLPPPPSPRSQKS